MSILIVSRTYYGFLAIKGLKEWWRVLSSGRFASLLNSSNFSILFSLTERTLRFSRLGKVSSNYSILYENMRKKKFVFCF
jgi:hypothetical protein